MPDAYIAHLFPAGGLPDPLFQTVRRACRTPRGEASADRADETFPPRAYF